MIWASSVFWDIESMRAWRLEPLPDMRTVMRVGAVEVEDIADCLCGCD